MTIIIDLNTCIKCGCCIDSCSQGALEFDDNDYAVVDEETCINCLSCIDMCPVSAISQGT